MQRTVILLIINLCFLHSSSDLHPSIKSLIIPGWGESVAGYQNNSKFFILSESILLFSIFSIHKYAEVEKSKFITFAYEYSNASNINNHRYWVDIGNYGSNIDFDKEHLRMRDGKEGEWNSNPWMWDKDSNRREFEKMRIRNDKLHLINRFLIGGVVLNHIVSSIDALYLSKISKSTNSKISLKPGIRVNNQNFTYGVFFELNI